MFTDEQNIVQSSKENIKMFQPICFNLFVQSSKEYIKMFLVFLSSVFLPLVDICTDLRMIILLYNVNNTMTICVEDEFHQVCKDSEDYQIFANLLLGKKTLNLKGNLKGSLK